MINSNSRKLSLSGWLKKYNNKVYNTSLKLQKFLLLYEAFTKVAGEKADFSSLKGYKNGPVFSNVWGDYTKARIQFDLAAEVAYEKNSFSIDLQRAKRSAFIVSTLTEKELSDLTHQLNLWKSKEERIMSGEYQVSLNEIDFNIEDENFILTLESIYPMNMIESSEIISVDKKFFVFSKKDIQQLTEKHYDILLTLSEDENIYNPVFVEIDEGRLIID